MYAVYIACACVQSVVWWAVHCYLKIMQVHGTLVHGTLRNWGYRITGLRVRYKVIYCSYVVRTSIYSIHTRGGGGWLFPPPKGLGHRVGTLYHPADLHNFKIIKAYRTTSTVPGDAL